MGRKANRFIKVLFILVTAKRALLCGIFFAQERPNQVPRMKNLYSLLIVLFLAASAQAQGTQTGGGFAFAASAHKQASGLDDVIAALRSGSASDFGRFVEDHLEISLPGKTDNYSRQQAIVILQDFFSANGVKNFDPKHRGDNGGNQFCIGTLATRSGNYRTTFFMTPKNGKQYVKEIRFQTM